MKRIWIAGSSGSGKTTLANLISEKSGIPIYHRDYITWHEDFTMRSEEEQIALTKNITKAEKWIFEGARFTSSRIDGRLDRCDTIINLDMNRFICAYRVFKRARKQSKRTDLSAVDRQPCSFNLLRYVLWEYPRKHNQRKKVFDLAKEKGIKIITLKTRKDVLSFLTNNEFNSV